MIKQIIVVVSFVVTLGSAYVVLHPYISKVPPVYRIVQVAGPLQFQQPHVDTVIPSTKPQSEDAEPNTDNNNKENLDAAQSASTPNIQLMPGVVLPYGYAVTGVVPYTGYVPTGSHYIPTGNPYLPNGNHYVAMYYPNPALHPSFYVGDNKKVGNNGKKKAEENNGVRTVHIGPIEGEESSGKDVVVTGMEDESPIEPPTETRRKRQSQTGPVVEFTFPELRIKSPPENIEVD